MATSLVKNTVAVFVNGVKTNALVDTCASISVISTAFLSKTSFENLVLQTPDYEFVNGVGGHLKVLGKLNIPISFKGGTLSFPVHVVDRLPHSLIIGLDFLKKHQVTLNLAENTMSFYNDSAKVNVLKIHPPLKSESQIPSFIYKAFSTPTPVPSDFDLLIQNFSWNHAFVLMNTIVVSLLLFCFLYNLHLQRKNRFTQIVIELTTGGECIFVPVLNLPLCPSFWKIVPPTDIFYIDDLTLPFASTMKFDWIGFNVINISGTRTINVKSKVSLNIFSALKAKRTTEQPYDVHILVSHHNVYQSLPHHGSYIVDTLNPNEHLPFFDLLFSIYVQDHNIFFLFLHIHLELSRFLVAHNMCFVEL